MRGRGQGSPRPGAVCVGVTIVIVVSCAAAGMGALSPWPRARGGVNDSQESRSLVYSLCITTFIFSVVRQEELGPTCLRGPRTFRAF